ncbi:3,9-dihydroxypterocarpan 6A-monooxygenase-like [Gastrolobium bilobum]|uniref:3,9-dihydroxypterocarpan 6A-monooxygenase-like n=1 Tax=Gastrolobium bilobum TaxID=150636 RepID=UPI002AB24DF3|nr:3,9-dihydroxypterocarpan 6A-monooxygenase-like [Gastrolobium bilobum]
MAEFQDYVILFLVCLVSTILVRAIFTKKKNKGHRPPSPPALPIIGNLHLISQLPHQSFHKLSTRYGPIMQIFLGSVPCVVVSNPEIAKEFLKTHETCFSNRFTNYAVHYLSYGCKGFLFAPYGNYWKFMKKICMSELLGGRNLDKLLPLRQQETLRFLRLLQKKGEAGEGVDVGGELLTLANSIISRMTMSQTSSESDNDVEEIRKMVIDTAELAGKFNVSDFIWFCKNFDLHGMKKRLKEIHDRFDTMMEKVIEEHEKERKRRKEGGEYAEFRDLLDILLEIHEDESTEIKFTRENIKAFILDIFMAGTDTSAITTEWALAELINNPHVMEKARQEIDSVTGKIRLIKESDLVNLPYLQAIVKETLRIHPTAPFIGRESSESCIVCGYEIPAKTSLIVNLWSMGRDPNLWKDPLEFRPERFISEENQLDVRGQNFQLMPFGTGRRMCPGTSLALQVVPTTLAAMIQCFEWKVDGTVNMEEKPAMTLPRSYPLVCVPVPRFNCVPSTV